MNELGQLIIGIIRQISIGLYISIKLEFISDL